MRTMCIAAAAAGLSGSAASAQDAVKIGLILPMTGPQGSTGKQIDAAVRLYVQQNGSTVVGRKIEIILKDDGPSPTIPSASVGMQGSIKQADLRTLDGLPRRMGGFYARRAFDLLARRTLGAGGSFVMSRCSSARAFWPRTG
jgi:hypothetical protein